LLKKNREALKLRVVLEDDIEVLDGEETFSNDLSSSVRILRRWRAKILSMGKVGRVAR
jgi:hypothetical protein